MLSVEALILSTISGTKLIAVLPSRHVGRSTSGLSSGSSLLVQRDSSRDRTSSNVEQEGRAIVTSSNEGVGAHPEDIHEGELGSLDNNLVMRRSRALQHRNGAIVRNPSELVSIRSPTIVRLQAKGR